MRELTLREKFQHEFLDVDPRTAEIVDPFANRTRRDIEEPHFHLLRVMRDPKYAYFTCKSLMNGPGGKPLELFPFQVAIIRELWNRPLPMLIANRGGGKSYLLGVYALLRATFIQGRKVVIVGSGFRQAKGVFQVAETIWHNSPVLQSLFADSPQSGPKHDSDRWVLRVGDSTITALPLGDGRAIRGERAHDLLTDEFASIPWEIYETAVKPFTAVEMDPMGAAMRRAEIRVLRREGVWTEEMAEHERSSRLANQSVIAGTAYYQFNHFFDYWRRWKTIVESQGDRRRLEEAFTSGVAANIDHRDYSIIRIPYGLLPEGFLSETIINDAAATYNTSVFMNEYESVFASDSNGFFRRSLIESCVTKEPISPVTSPGEFVRFQAATRGSPDGHYVYGIDPASEADRFSIVILEVHPTHRRIVYCWTTTRQQHKQRVQAKATKVEDFYGFCARKIRELMRVFPCEHIALDSQGGGVAVAEALHDPDKMEDGEQPLWTISADHPLSDGKERDTDANAGLHIIEMVHFARAEWVADANHGMRKDFEDRVLLFPDYDTGVLAIAMEDDQRAKRVFDTLEDAVAEVEEIKEELATIVHTQTGSTLRDRWDTPEVKLAGSRKGRLRKDRYSALLMANSAARRLNRRQAEPDLLPLGGFVQHSAYAPQPSHSEKMYISAPDWFTSGLSDERDSFGWAVNRHGVGD